MINLYLHNEIKKNKKEWFLSPKKEHELAYLFSDKDIKTIEEDIDFEDILMGLGLFCSENNKIDALKTLFNLEYERIKINEFNDKFRGKKIYSNDKLDEDYNEEIFIIEYENEKIGIYLNITELRVIDRVYFFNRDIAKNILKDYFDCFKKNEIMEICNFKYFCENLNIEELNFFDKKVFIKETSSF